MRVRDAHQEEKEVWAQSFAILDSRGQVIGGPFNEMMLPLDVAPSSCGSSQAVRSEPEAAEGQGVGSNQRETLDHE